MNPLTQNDYLDYQSTEVLKLRKDLKRTYKFFSVFNKSIHFILGFSIIPFFLAFFSLATQSPSEFIAIFYALITVGWVFSYILYIINMPRMLSKSHEIIVNTFLNSLFSKKLKHQFYLLFNSNHKIRNIFFKKSNEFIFTSKKESYLVDLYDFLKNVEDKNLSQKDISFFLQQDESLSEHFKFLKEEQNRKEKINIMNDLISQKNSQSVDVADISKTHNDKTYQDKHQLIEQEFNFSKA